MERVKLLRATLIKRMVGAFAGPRLVSLFFPLRVGKGAGAMQGTLLLLCHLIACVVLRFSLRACFWMLLFGMVKGLSTRCRFWVLDAVKDEDVATLVVVGGFVSFDGSASYLPMLWMDGGPIFY
ncbi:hypothetical protein SUGI_0812790 [Cryptomeria japonica]|nr:hypothetical protein SUGI_0812790 [Cryptomeria japonica]